MRRSRPHASAPPYRRAWPGRERGRPGSAQTRAPGAEKIRHRPPRLRLEAACQFVGQHRGGILGQCASLEREHAAKLERKRHGLLRRRHSNEREGPEDQAKPAAAPERALLLCKDAEILPMTDTRPDVKRSRSASTTSSQNWSEPNGPTTATASPKERESRAHGLRDGGRRGCGTMSPGRGWCRRRPRDASERTDHRLTVRHLKKKVLPGL